MAATGYRRAAWAALAGVVVLVPTATLGADWLANRSCFAFIYKSDHKAAARLAVAADVASFGRYHRLAEAMWGAQPASFEAGTACYEMTDAEPFVPVDADR